jgi:hypothetical protein
VVAPFGEEEAMGSRRSEREKTRRRAGPTQPEDPGPRIDPAGGPEDDRDAVFDKAWWESIVDAVWDDEKGAFDWSRFADDPYPWIVAGDPPTRWPPEKDDVPFYDEPWE